MAKKTNQYSKHVSNMIKLGCPRKSKLKKGNAPARTAKSGSGRRIRQRYGDTKRAQPNGRGLGLKIRSVSVRVRPLAFLEGTIKMYNKPYTIRTHHDGSQYVFIHNPSCIYDLDSEELMSIIKGKIKEHQSEIDKWNDLLKIIKTSGD